ncbi:sulfotransferase family protein [Shewanella woodyi]|uniref:sulfotransferase family protein n=1 Tax=Shewanella woodyi TaxID=60961 RepID=UPI00374A06A0
MNFSGFDRPIIILSAPRSGSTLLFETLSKSKNLWTIGGESHAVIEKYQQLNITHKNFASNILNEKDWSPALDKALKHDFSIALLNAKGERYNPNIGPIRFLEKTPKNSLRIDFFEKLFPDAYYIYLVRDPKENISSIMQAWLSQRFCTYPNLPGWGGDWSLLLPPNWQQFKGQPLEAVATFQWQQANEMIMQSLAKIAQQRWHMINYQELIDSPTSVIEKLTQFCDLPFDHNLKKLCEDGLPYSRYTISKPEPNKWLSNYSEIESIWGKIGSTLQKINSILVESGQIKLSEKWPFELEPKNPKLFIKNSTLTSNSNYSGVSRNSLCPCASGKRFKHCHGKLS